MAERLAPECTPPTITSRPERRGRSRFRWVRVLLLVGCAIVLVVGVVVGTAHVLVIDHTVPTMRPTALVPAGHPASVLVVVARPGQELLMAGTIRGLTVAGARVSMLALTRGETQPPSLGTTSERRAELRAGEVAESAAELGVDAATSATYPDGGLVGADPVAVIGTVAEAIEASSPSVILTVDDLTGGRDPDSRATASYVQSAAQALGSGVARVWVVTRGEREAAWAGRLGAVALHPASILEPHAAVRIGASAIAKGRALAAHGTQSPSLAATAYPLADRVPAWAYFRLLDREYLHLAWGDPLP